MTTYAPQDATLDERTRKAWDAYREELAGLNGRAYDEAETTAWERLQTALQDIADDRAALHTGGEAEH